MKRVLAWFLAVVAFLFIALGVLVVVFVDTSPVVTRANTVTEWGRDRAQAVLERLDPRALSSDEVRVETLEGQDADSLANYIASTLYGGRAFFKMGEGTGTLRFSREMPWPLTGNFLNVQVELATPAQQIEIQKIQIGRYVLPKTWTGALLEEVIDRSGKKDLIDTVSARTRRVAFAPQAVTLTFAMKDDLLEDVRALALNSDERMQLYQAQSQLARLTSGPVVAGKIPLSGVLTSMLRASGSKSDEDLLAEEYRAALFVLSAHASGVSLSRLLPEARTWPSARRVQFTLRGREDVARHFLVAAAAAAWNGEPLGSRILDFWSNVKELDAGQFSFAAMMGSRAGVRFGEMTQDEPQRLAAHAVRDRFLADQLLPDWNATDTTWGDVLSEGALQQQYGGFEGARFRETLNKVEGVISALPLFNPPTAAEKELMRQTEPVLGAMAGRVKKRPPPAGDKGPYPLDPKVEFKVEPVPPTPESEPPKQIHGDDTQPPAPVVEASPQPVGELGVQEPRP